MSPIDPRVPIVDQINHIAESVPGWTPVDQLFALFNLAYATASVPGDILEIGSWCGRSTAVLGLATRRCGFGRLHCVDLFPHRDDWHRNDDGSYSFAVEIDGVRHGGYQDQTVWAEPFERDIAPIYAQHEHIRDVFDATLDRFDLADLVSVYRGDAAVFANKAPRSTRCRLAFIDGDHGFDAVCRDIEIVQRYLSPGGWVCFDDAFSTYDGVNNALERCVIQNPDFGLCQQLTRKCFAACWKPAVPRPRRDDQTGRRGGAIGRRPLAYTKPG